MPTIKIEVEIKDEMINDIFITAIEQGIGYWAVASQTEYTGEGSSLTYVSAMLADREEAFTWGSRSRLEFTWHRLDKDVIVKGIERIMSGEVGIRSDLHAQISESIRADDCDIDADAADCIVQAGIFGELVYG